MPKQKPLLIRLVDSSPDGEDFFAQKIVNDHIKQFPLSTAMDIVDRLHHEANNSNGLDDIRTERLKALFRSMSILVDVNDDLRLRRKRS